MTHEKARYRAVADDGTVYTIKKSQHRKTFHYLSDPPETLDTLAEYSTTDGQNVNRRKDGSFEIVSSGVILQLCEA